MSPRTGRPLQGESKKDIRLSLRLNTEEARLIDECAERLDTTRVDAIMRGIRLVKQALDKQK